MSRRARSLGPGDPAPDITLPDDTGKPTRLAEFRPRPVVVFFFPGAFTPVCTKEACNFRDEHADFADAGAVVVGISPDSPKRLAMFRSAFALPYVLLSDAEGSPSARERFSVPKALGLISGRVTYVIDGAGIIRHAFAANMRARRHVEEALAALTTDRATSARTPSA